MIPETDSRFLRACNRLPVDATPVWFMRQAGRYMPEYRALRSRYTLLEMVARPDLAAEITLQPVRALGVDAAILFADILLPVQPMGLQLEFAAGEGPVIANPVRDEASLARLRKLEARNDLEHVLQAIRLVRRELEGRTPLIGFAGAPFTMAAYMVEGGASRNFVEVKRLMYSRPDLWASLLTLIADSLAEYLTAQVEAGVQAVQVFDSWVGALSQVDYQRYVFPYSRRLLAALKPAGVPLIHFGTGTGHLLKLMEQAGGSVIGLDWRAPLDLSWAVLGGEVAVQGNLDPVALFAPLPVLSEQVNEILRRADGRPGHIFNLGHGILEHTPVEHVRAVVDMVHERTDRRKGR
jgi:uroporphyrinogen decarboxylase